MVHRNSWNYRLPSPRTAVCFRLFPAVSELSGMPWTLFADLRGGRPFGTCPWQ
ncbi:predicted protein [Streptomyces viridosporus ATCC 14672]|uniref:Predicted protein n=1 Tax=Streptomyces viridosporus (strain ATCC 14672 / DSM 40746 / JCM 4963 / KCTC 9882 / NRRL B-12104 / FH 1290) TaxID=566461 RepID=D6A1B1_STRV1|nr:predicted protein [Streptomyces viridosporus ATCC 14672]